MSHLTVVVCAAFGLLIGSFLNVVVWRVPRGESIVRPPSRCPACDRRICARDNVPVVSWFLLRGRCRHCGARISARYPIIEVLTAILFGALAWHFGPSAVLPAYLYLAAVGLALAVIDLDVRRLPNVLTVPSYVIGAALLGIGVLADGGAFRVVDALAGMAMLYVFYFFLFIAYPRGLGFGDVKLAGVLGLYLGFLGWDVLVVGAFLGFLLGGLVGVALMMAQKATRKSMIPFGPFMVAGALIAVFVGHALAHGYTSITFG